MRFAFGAVSDELSGWGRSRLPKSHHLRHIGQRKVEVSQSISSRFTLRARYVFDGRGRVLEDGFVSVEGALIAAVGTGDEVSPVADSDQIDLGDVAILPGLVNAHTHLEFSMLSGPLGQPGIRLVDWIPLVIAHRTERVPSVDESVAVGLTESAASGTTLLGEIATEGWSGAPLNQAAIGGTVFFEVIGLLPEQCALRLEQARQRVGWHGLQGWQTGLSPHAPYSVSQALVADLVELADRRRLPLAMHLAESPEEVELLRTGRGPFREWLESMGLWSPDALACGSRILDYLRMLATAPRALVIHGNYLDEDEIAFLARHRRTMSVVYCPRTHAFFGHAPHPVERLLAAGARVALGTDSRASNPSLSMLDEMRFLARARPGIPREQIVQLATLFGAEALGVGDRTGSLEAGKQADMVLVSAAQGQRYDPYSAVLDSDEPVIATIQSGRLAFGELPNC